MITDLNRVFDVFTTEESAYIQCDCMDLMRMLPDKSIGLAICDPVYGGVTRGGYMTDDGSKIIGHSAAKRKAYNLSIWDQKKTPKEYFDELFRVSKNQIIWGGNYFVESINKDSQGWIVWDKQKHEGLGFADGELAWTSFDRALKIFRYKWDGMIQANMKDKEVRIHPCHKPIALYKWLLQNYTESPPHDEIILDTHTGSASSLIACEQLGYKFIGCEIDENYYKISKERFEKETAQITMFNMGLEAIWE